MDESSIKNLSNFFFNSGARRVPEGGDRVAGDRVFQQQRHLQAGRGQVGGRVLDTGRGVQVGGQDQRQELPRVHGQEAAEPRPLHQQEGNLRSLMIV